MVSTQTKLAQPILFALSIIFCIPAYGILEHTKEKIFKTIENPMIYNIGTCIIDKTALVLSNGIAKFAGITRFKETPEQKKKRFNKYLYRIDQRLNQIENNLKQDEINAFNNVYEEFEITNKEQETINAIIQQYKEHQQQYLCQSHEEMVDTLEEEKDFPEILFYCNQLNIHPTAIGVKIIDSSNSIHVADSTFLKTVYQVDDNNNVMIDDNIIDYPAIRLYPQFFELSYEDRVAVVGHELTHVALQHLSTYNILCSEIKYFTEVTTEEIKKSKHLKNLEIIHERQAEILYKNAEWASIMRKKRNRGYYKGCLFLGHYAQLTEIDELHKLKNKFKNML